MKILIGILFSLASFSSMAQTITGFQFRTVVTFSSGASVTNTVNVNTNLFPSIQFAIDRYNGNAPASTKITNFGQFFIQVAKDRVNQATNDYDELTLSQKLTEKIRTLSEADKNAIRAIINASP